jgi:DNA-binding PadR family transcriptional regulator
MSSLSATARVILGILAFGPATGYDVKRVTDKSTRFFWRASYGQIYPELRKLEEAGLVRASEKPHGKRRRRVYELTAAGKRAVADWLEAEDDLYEVRDEGLLRLFFGELVSQEQLLALVRRRKEVYEGVVELFQGIGADLGEIEGPSGEVLRYGIELMEWNAKWWADLESRLSDGGARS